ncbi:ABC transporter permease [Bacillus gobiensis]|uniref:ABC transporter permease n=1 Tax=Bacillus gobiensis TaxID=1441095 RepID=UPI003D25BE03
MIFLKSLQLEWYKVRKSKILLLIWLGPMIALMVGLSGSNEMGTSPWHEALMYISMVYGLLFLPLFTGILAGSICRYEHQNNSWKQMLTLPVTRSTVFWSKYVLVLFVVAFLHIMVFAVFWIAGTAAGYTEPFPVETIAKSMIGSLIAVFPIAALLLWVGIAWTSFAAPFALNVIFTLPSMLVANSETYGPIYPWTQPFLMMMPVNEGEVFYVPMAKLSLVIGGSLIVFLAGGLMYMKKKAI